jgi:hypothetical protein
VKNKILLLLIGLIFFANAAAALAPQKATLPFYWITGGVKDPSPQHLAVPDVGVFLYKDAADLEKKQFLSTKTDKNGNYRFNAYELYYFYGKEFPYKVAVPQKDGYGAEALVNPIKTAGFIQQDLVLAGGQGPVFKTGSVSVIVTDAGDNPITNASVYIDGSNLSGIYQGNGEYLIENVPVGYQLVIISAPGYMAGNLLVFVEEGKTYSAGKMVLAALPEGAAALWGFVKDLKGNQLGGVKITAGSYLISSFNSGWYQLILPAGSYSVTASLTGYADNTLGNLGLNAGDSIHHDFVLSLLDPGGAGALSGTVKDKVSDLPVPGALIGDGTRNTQTGPDGAYLIDSVPQGDYLVGVAANNYVPEIKPAAVKAKATTVVDFALTKLDPGKAAIVGMVRDNNGKGLKGAAVKILDPLLSAITGDNGGYSFINIAPGELMLEASLSGYSTQQVPVSLPAGGVMTIDFALFKTPPPAGTVPLSIDREGDNQIKISWAENTAPDIYYLTGNGEGSFSASKGWIKVLDGKKGTITPGISGFSPNISAKNIIHNNQYGKKTADGGIKEVYFKGLVPGQAVEKLAAAWAVGKLDIDIYKGLNLISVPFKKQNLLLDNVLGNGLLPDGASYYKLLSPAGGDYFRAYLKKNIGWYDASDNTKLSDTSPSHPKYPNILIDPKYGFFIDASAPGVLTVFGDVINEEVKVDIAGKGFTILGMLYPQAVGLAECGLFNAGDPANSAADNDNLYYKVLGANADYLRAYLSGGKWKDASNEKEISDPAFNANLKTLKTPSAYFYYRKGNAFGWKKKKAN